MTTYVALLRGINVGGRNSLPMTTLVKILESLGLEQVRTYIQSGNVLFRSRKSRTGLAKQIREAIGKTHGFTPDVFVLRVDELQQAMRSNPFPEAEAEPKSLHLYFLASSPKEPNLEAMEAIRGERERFAIDGNVFYLHAPDGIGRSKLATNAERRLGVPATARNWRTVTKLFEMATTLE